MKRTARELRSELLSRGSLSLLPFSTADTANIIGKDQGGAKSDLFV
jgi:hypothetical protein